MPSVGSWGRIWNKPWLACLQANASLSTSEVAEQVGLTTTPCWRRIQNLEREGVIKRRVALLDRHRLNVGVDVFVAIRTNQHNAKWLESFAAVVHEFPEVVEFYRMNGEMDYLIRVVVPDWLLRRLCQSSPHRGYKFKQIVEASLDDVAKYLQVDPLVAVYDDVSKSSDLAHRLRLIDPQPTAPCKKIEQFAIGFGLSQALLGDDVRRHIESSLDRNLKRMGDETLLSYIVFDHIQSCHVAELANAGFYESELFRQ